MNQDQYSNPQFQSDLGRDLVTDFDLMRQIANDLVDLAEAKDRSYGASWKRRGGPGAYLTFVRKPDRLEAQMEKAGYNVFDVTIAPEDGESIDETLRDNINYSMLILTTRELIRQKIKQMRINDAAANTPLEPTPSTVEATPTPQATDTFKPSLGDGGLDNSVDDQDDSSYPTRGYVNQG